MDNGINNGGSPPDRSVAAMMRREPSCAEAQLILGYRGESAGGFRHRPR
ncbi:MAG TPA: hypothetical protein VFR28_07795 [Allosphingosinicella sp.]|jgi:hypothetical protein|nr:hypothetical protein [Allosphingosinicella sp.]